LIKLIFLIALLFSRHPVVKEEFDIWENEQARESGRYLPVNLQRT